MKENLWLHLSDDVFFVFFTWTAASLFNFCDIVFLFCLFATGDTAKNYQGTVSFLGSAGSDYPPPPHPSHGKICDHFCSSLILYLLASTNTHCTSSVLRHSKRMPKYVLLTIQQLHACSLTSSFSDDGSKNVTWVSVAPRQNKTSVSDPGLPRYLWGVLHERGPLIWEWAPTQISLSGNHPDHLWVSTPSLAPYTAHKHTSLFFFAPTPQK